MEIAGGGGAEDGAEHGDEGAGGAVSGVEGGVGDLGAFGQEAHGVHEAELLAPLAEGRAGFLLKEALDCSSARAGSVAELLERLRVAGIFCQQLRDAHGSWIGQVRKLQGDHLNGFELVDDGVDQVELRGDGLLQSAIAAGVEDQFTQQRGDIDHATVAWEGARQFRFEVEGAHGYHARHGDGVRDGGGDPDGAVRGHDPGAGAGADGHDSAGGVDELVAIVEVQRDNVGGGIVTGQSGDGRGAVGGAVVDRALALLRH